MMKEAIDISVRKAESLEFARKNGAVCTRIIRFACIVAGNGAVVRSKARCSTDTRGRGINGVNMMIVLSGSDRKQRDDHKQKLLRRPPGEIVEPVFGSVKGVNKFLRWTFRGREFGKCSMATDLHGDQFEKASKTVVGRKSQAGIINKNTGFYSFITIKNKNWCK